MSHNSTPIEQFKVRRATSEDLPGLHELWNAERLPAEVLDKRFGEFQVVEAPDGKLVGALGLQKIGKDGYIHSECYKDFELSDKLRPLLWERFQNMIANHGLYRVWTKEKAPFWKQLGFVVPTEHNLKRWPEVLGPSSGDAIYMQLKDEDAIASLDKEFEMFRASEEARTAEIMSTAKSLKTFALFFGIAVFLMVIACTIYLIKAGHIFKR